jgi:hypothetical protein
LSRYTCWQNAATELGKLGWAIVERLQDPLTWCLIAVVIVLVLQRFRWWQAFLVTIAFAAINITTMRIWMAASGRDFSSKEAWRMFVALLIIGLAAHGIGHIISRFRARRLKTAE